MLELVGVTRRYGDVLALDGLSVTVPPGQMFGFLGPNGAGKTTAMRTILGLSTPDAGEVRWNGKPIGRDERLRFGYLPEERGLYPRMAVAEQLVYLACLHGAAPAAAKAATEQWLERRPPQAPRRPAHQGRLRREAPMSGNSCPVRANPGTLHVIRPSSLPQERYA